MAFKIQQLQAQETVRTREQWQYEVERVLAQGQTGFGERSPQMYREAFESCQDWSDPHWKLQAHKTLCELLRFIDTQHPNAWAPFYLVAAEQLLASLREQRFEPWRWNALGVILYELGATVAAERIFRACGRLDPDFPELKRNQRSAAKRKSQNFRSPFNAEIKRLIKQLATESRALADTTKPKDPAEFRLSLAMIVKDEEEMLPACLESAASVADEIVVVDTGSSDRTVEIAEQFGAKVIHFAWTGSFAEARNVSLEAASGDWILHLDADERLAQGDAQRLRAMLNRTWREGFSLIETNYTGAESSGAAVTHQPIRVWRHRPHYRFEGAIHEQKTQNMPTFLPERFEQTKLRILHYGYLKERINSREKSQRNMELLEKEAQQNPSPFNRFNLASEYMVLGDYARARVYLEEAWGQLKNQSDWTELGYSSMLLGRLVESYRHTGDLDAAEQVILQGLKSFPDYTDLVFERALVARERGHMEQALSLAERALQMGDAPPILGGTVGRGSHLALALIGELQAAQGQRQEAIATWREGLAQYPDYSAPVIQLASMLLGQGESPQSVMSELMPLAQRSMTSTGVLLASALLETGATPEASQLFEAVLERSPSHPVARLGLVECALAEQDLGLAAQRAQSTPQDPAAPFLLPSQLLLAQLEGQNLTQLLDQARQLGLPASEIELFEKWSQPDSEPLSSAGAGACLSALSSLLRLQRFEAAEQLIELYRASLLDPRARYERLARLFLRQGFLDSAAEEWLTAIDELGPDADAVLGLAQISYAQERSREAMGLAEDALGLDPDHVGAQRMLANLRRREQA